MHWPAQQGRTSNTVLGSSASLDGRSGQSQEPRVSSGSPKDPSRGRQQPGLEPVPMWDAALWTAALPALLCGRQTRGLLDSQDPRMSAAWICRNPKSDTGKGATKGSPGSGGLDLGLQPGATCRPRAHIQYRPLLTARGDGSLQAPQGRPWLSAEAYPFGVYHWQPRLSEPASPAAAAHLGSLLGEADNSTAAAPGCWRPRKSWEAAGTGLLHEALGQGCQGRLGCL